MRYILDHITEKGRDYNNFAKLRKQKLGRLRTLDVVGQSAREEGAMHRKTPEVCTGFP